MVCWAQLASGSADGTLMVWNFRPSLRAFRYLGHKVGHTPHICTERFNEVFGSVVALSQPGLVTKGSMD